MSFTPQEETGLRVIFNSFVSAGYQTPEQVTAMLTRLKLVLKLLSSFPVVDDFPLHWIVNKY